MVSRLEIALKKTLLDAEGAGIAGKARDYLGLDVDSVRVIRVLTFDADLDQERLETARTHLFSNPVTEESSFAPLARDFDWLIWISFRPGVRDTAGSTAAEAIEDLFKIKLRPDETVYTSRLYAVTGSMSRAQASTLASEILANDIIQQWKVFGPEEWEPAVGVGHAVPRVILDHEPRVSTIAVGSDEELKRISEERNLALQESDIPVIRKYFLRKDILADRMARGLSLPTDVELEYISQSRSDHCNHNTFRGLFRYADLSSGHREVVDNLFKTCIEAPTLEIKAQKDWVVSVLWDNAGVARFDDRHYYVITGETHNSPSNMEAYGGSLTGIVGIYRDPMGTGKGAKLILGTYGFCVGPRDYQGELKPRLHPRGSLTASLKGSKTAGTKAAFPPLSASFFFTRATWASAWSLSPPWGSCPQPSGMNPVILSAQARAISSSCREEGSGKTAFTALRLLPKHTPNTPPQGMFRSGTLTRRRRCMTSCLRRGMRVLLLL